MFALLTWALTTASHCRGTCTRLAPFSLLEGFHSLFPAGEACSYKIDQKFVAKISYLASDEPAATFSAKSPSACCLACASTQGCLGWSFFVPPFRASGDCHLYSANQIDNQRVSLEKSNPVSDLGTWTSGMVSKREYSLSFAHHSLFANPFAICRSATGLGLVELNGAYLHHGSMLPNQTGPGKYGCMSGLVPWPGQVATSPTTWPTTCPGCSLPTAVPHVCLCSTSAGLHVPTRLLPLPVLHR